MCLLAKCGRQQNILAQKLDLQPVPTSWKVLLLDEVAPVAARFVPNYTDDRRAKSDMPDCYSKSANLI